MGDKDEPSVFSQVLTKSSADKVHQIHAEGEMKNQVTTDSMFSTTSATTCFSGTSQRDQNFHDPSVVHTIFGGAGTSLPPKETPMASDVQSSMFKTNSNATAFGVDKSSPVFGIVKPSLLFGNVKDSPVFYNVKPSAGFGTPQPSTAFETTQPSASFVTTQPSVAFGTTQPTTAFGSTQPTAVFGTTHPSTAFAATKSSAAFGTAKSSAAFGTTKFSAAFGTTQPSASFVTTQHSVAFGTTQPTAAFGTHPSTAFGTTKPSAAFGTTKPSAAFGTTQPFGTVKTSQAIGVVKSSPAFGGVKSSTFGGVKSSPAFGGVKSSPAFGGVKLSSTSETVKPSNVFGSTKPNPVFGADKAPKATKNTEPSSAFGTSKVLNVAEGAKPSPIFVSVTLPNLTEVTKPSPVFGIQSQKPVFNVNKINVTPVTQSSKKVHSLFGGLVNTPDTSSEIRDSGSKVDKPKGLSRKSIPLEKTVDLTKAPELDNKSIVGSRKENERKLMKESVWSVDKSPSTHAEVKSNPSTIIVMDIPSRCNDKRVLLKHFSKFGSIERIVSYVSQRKAVVYFTEPESAALAKATGKCIHPNYPELIIMFSTRKSLKKKSKTDEKHTEISRVSSPSAKNKPIIAASEKNPTILVKCAALSNLEKYEALEARDKLLRSQQLKILDVKNAKYLTASCPDMCPEKERYMRDVQCDLSSYEISNGLLDHRRAVKKYSRSSADKDEPLPHELRPGPILRMTMDYLVSNVMDTTSDNSVEVWYNYLWNRTRALRNDIMQQHLISSDAVYVLERCVRFHIHCAHHLCEEDFDQKMNDEHLFKSLQSLKESYYDLAERGIYFDSENEFRSYEILLNLMDGDVIYNYQNLRNSVRQSTEVQFSVQCLHALYSRNYVRFFALVEEASYLHSCILFRYYSEVRAKAMNIILKSYMMVKNAQSLPKKSIMKMLGIRSDAELTTFLSFYKLNVSDNMILIERRPMVPTGQMPLIRDHMTLFKLTSAGRVVHGGEVPWDPTKEWTPHNSFADGYLKKEALNGSDQTSLANIRAPLDMNEEELELHLMHRMSRMHEMKLLQRYFNRWKSHIQIEKKVENMVHKRELKIALKSFRKWQEFVCDMRTKRNHHFMKITKMAWRKWIQYTNNKRNLRHLKQDITNRVKRIIAKKMLITWKRNASILLQERVLKRLRSSLIARKFAAIWKANAVLSRKLKSASQYNDSRMLQYYFTLWKNFVSYKKEKKQFNYEHYPANSSCLTSKEINHLWNFGYHRNSHENVTALQLKDLQNRILLNWSNLKVIQSIDQQIAWKPLPFIDRFQEYIDNFPDDYSVYNQTLSIEIVIDPGVKNSYVYRIRNMFSLNQNFSGPLNLKTVLTSSNRRTFGISIRESDYQSMELKHESCLILVTSLSSLADAQLLFQSKHRTPLVICESIDSAPRTGDVWYASIHDLRGSSFSCDLYKYVIKFWMDYKNDNTIYESSLRNVATKFIYNHVIKNIVTIMQQRKIYGEWITHPNIIIEFLNDGFEHVWGCVGNQTSVPKLPSIAIPESRDYQKEVNILINYVNLIIGKNWGGDLQSEIRQILTKSSGLSVPWLDVFHAIVQFQLTCVPEVLVKFNPTELTNFKPKHDYVSFLQIYTEPTKVRPTTPKRKLRTSTIEELQAEPFCKRTRHLLSDISKEKEKMNEIEEQINTLLSQLDSSDN